MTPAHRPKLAVWKFASCDGRELELLDCADELLAIAGQIKIAYFVIRRFLPTCAARPVSLSPFRMRYQAKVADGGKPKLVADRRPPAVQAGSLIPSRPKQVRPRVG